MFRGWEGFQATRRTWKETLWLIKVDKTEPNGYCEGELYKAREGSLQREGQIQRQKTPDDSLTWNQNFLFHTIKLSGLALFQCSFFFHI